MSISVCVLKHLLEKLEDEQIRPVMEYALSLGHKHIQTVTGFLNKENSAIPYDFKEDEDLFLDAPRLYSDSFALIYVHNMAKFGLTAFGMALSNSVRSDICDFYTECVASFTELYKKSLNVLLSIGGVFQRAPYIPLPQKVEFVQQQNFLTGWFGDRRPLNAMEFSNLYYNVQRNAVGKALLMGFSQVAKSEQVRQYTRRGADEAGKHIEVFTSILREDDLPYLVTWDSDVTNSTISPFSDKLIMFHTTTLIASGLATYGASLVTSSRRDLSAHYTRLMAQVGQYAEDGANILIQNGWMEKPPQAEDRRALARR